MQLFRLLFSAFLLSLAGQAAAIQFSPISLHHTSWTAKDGAPPSIIAIAQTPDRWMWLASQNGIYRFDGVRFERFHPPGGQQLGNDIWGMRVLSNGALWIGYRSGGVSVWHKGVLHNYGVADGFPVASVLDFAEDWRGRIWASTSLGFRVFDGKRWEKMDQSRSGKTGQCFLQTDPDKTIWARCDPGVFKLAKGDESFGEKYENLGFGRLSLARDGTVWATGGKPGELIPLIGPGKDRPLPDWPRPRESGGTMLFERDGQHAWLTRADGVMRIGPGEDPKPFGIPNGMSGNMPNCLYQDVEGNIWVGTENGLDRFRVPVLSGVAMPPIYWDAPAIAAGDNGALWVDGNEVKTPSYQTIAALPPQNENTAVSVIHKNGRDVWTGGRDGLWHYRDGKREHIALPDYATTMQFHSIAQDKDGGLWVAARDAGVIRLKDGEWQRGGGYKDLKRRADWIMQDHAGRIWFGYMDNSIRVLEDGKVRIYDVKDGLHVGTAEQIVESGDGVWIGGLNGLFHFDGKKFVQVIGQGDDALLGLSGIVDYGGALWLNGSAGVTIVSKRELEKALADPRYRFSFRRLDHKDGLSGVATTAFPLPSAVAGTDGKLWFSTTAGLFWLDTKAEMRNKTPPPVYVRGANVDGVAFPMSDQGSNQLPANPGRVQIDYTALSYTMPERMQFQYLLEGVDRGWQQGGVTRTATYTDLGPGDYRFRVRASNNDGVWSESDAVMAFTVQPAFYQTIWFRVLCAGLLALGLWAIYKLRVAQVSRAVAGRIEARMEERERIARDLHDTLLQTVQASLLQMQTATYRLPSDSQARHDIERSLDLAQSALEEGRDKVHDLRAAPGTDLADDVCRTIQAEHPTLALACKSDGDATLITPCVYDELRAISLEAVRNAARHAQASRISYEVSYGRDMLTLTVRDDGRGLPDVVQSAGQAAGRWGLVGMRERAKRLGGQIMLVSDAGKGTVVTVEVPGKCAYRPLAA